MDVNSLAPKTPGFSTFLHLMNGGYLAAPYLLQPHMVLYVIIYDVKGNLADIQISNIPEGSYISNDD